jgi:hypothetical protein
VRGSVQIIDWSVITDHNIIENRSVFVKPGKINGPVLSVYRKLAYQIWKKIEIKNSKKTRVYFKIFDQIRFQKFEVLHPRKLMEVKISKITQFSQKLLNFTENRAVSLKIDEEHFQILFPVCIPRIIPTLPSYHFRSSGSRNSILNWSPRSDPHLLRSPFLHQKSIQSRSGSRSSSCHPGATMASSPAATRGRTTTLRSDGDYFTYGFHFDFESPRWHRLRSVPINEKIER